MVKFGKGESRGGRAGLCARSLGDGTMLEQACSASARRSIDYGARRLPHYDF